MVRKEVAWSVTAGMLSTISQNFTLSTLRPWKPEPGSVNGWQPPRTVISYFSLTVCWLILVWVSPQDVPVYLHEAASMLNDPRRWWVWFHSFSPRSYTDCSHADSSDHFTNLSLVWNFILLSGGATQGSLGLSSQQQLAVILCLSLLKFCQKRLLCYHKLDCWTPLCQLHTSVHACIYAGCN